MGGRGTYAAGNNVAYTYMTTEKIEDVKVLKGVGAKHDLPMESHSSEAYIKIDDKGIFKRLRVYEKNHLAKLDIDYHLENGKMELHYHTFEYGSRYKNGMRRTPGKPATTEMVEKYKKYFKGVNL